MRVDSRLNVNTPSSGTLAGSSSAGEVQKPLNQRVQDSLFGHRPTLFDLATASDEQQQTLQGLLRVLQDYRAKLDLWAGETPGAAIVLASNTIAAIDQDGTIYFDASFLLEHALDTDLLVGVLAHEVGHRPRQWASLRGQSPPGLSAGALDQICRYEEIRADTFAGRALAELSMSVEPMIALLARVQVEPHPRYLSASERADVLRQAHGDGARRVDGMRKHYPDMHRATALKNIIGVF